MDADLYFKMRADFVASTLRDGRADSLPVADRRFYVAGLLCVATAAIAVLWTSATQSDAGFFARTTTFQSFVLLAGLWLLTMAQAADVFMARVVVLSYDAVRESTLSQSLRIDGALANKMVQRRP